MYPLWTRRTAVHTAIVLVGLGDGKQLALGLRINLPQLAHRGGVGRSDEEESIARGR